MDAVNKALEVMSQLALELGVAGVAVAMVVQEGEEHLRPGMVQVITAEFPPIPGSGILENGANLWGIAAEKLAYMIRTQQDSGAEVGVKYGESPYAGGVMEVRDGVAYYAVFSGAADPEVDKKIANAGKEVLMSTS